MESAMKFVVSFRLLRLCSGQASGEIFLVTTMLSAQIGKTSHEFMPSKVKGLEMTASGAFLTIHPL